MGATETKTRAVLDHNRAAMSRWQARSAGGHCSVYEVPEPHQELVHADLEFARPDGHALLLDLYLPAHPVAPVPITVFGSTAAAGCTATAGQVPPVIGRFAARGLAVASIEYRLTDVARFPAPLDDVRSAVRWLREHADGLRARCRARRPVGLVGRGRTFVALAATSARDDADRVQAVVDGYGPTRLQDMEAQRRPAGRHPPRAPERAPRALLGASIDEAPAELAGCSRPDRPRHHRRAAVPDRPRHRRPARARSGQSIALHDALGAVGAESTLCLIDDLPHGLLRGNLLNRRPAPEAEIRTNAGSGEPRTARGPVTFEADRALLRPPPAPRSVERGVSAADGTLVAWLPDPAGPSLVGELPAQCGRSPCGTA